MTRIRVPAEAGGARRIGSGGGVEAGSARAARRAVFALNEELDEIRELRAGAPSTGSGRPERRVEGRGSGAGNGKARLERARQPIEAKSGSARSAELQELAAQWDAGGGQEALKALRDQFLERNYIHNRSKGSSESRMREAYSTQRTPRTQSCLVQNGPALVSSLSFVLVQTGDMSKVVGIDLGTTNSLVAFVKDGKPDGDPRSKRRRASCPRSCRSATKGRSSSAARRSAVSSPTRSAPSTR